MFVSQRFPNLRWLDGERGEGGDRERQGEGGGGDVRRERRELEWQLKQLEAIGSSSTNGRAEGLLHTFIPDLVLFLQLQIL